METLPEDVNSEGNNEMIIAEKKRPRCDVGGEKLSATPTIEAAFRLAFETSFLLPTTQIIQKHLGDNCLRKMISDRGPRKQ